MTKAHLDKAQAENTADLAEAFDDRAHDYAEKRKVLSQIEFGPNNEVSPGAVVRVGDRVLVAGISTTAVPIYSAPEGRTADKTCTFNGRELVVSEVH